MNKIYDLNNNPMFEKWLENHRTDAETKFYSITPELFTKCFGIPIDSVAFCYNLTDDKEKSLLEAIAYNILINLYFKPSDHIKIKSMRFSNYGILEVSVKCFKTKNRGG